MKVDRFQWMRPNRTKDQNAQAVLHNCLGVGIWITTIYISHNESMTDILSYTSNILNPRLSWIESTLKMGKKFRDLH
jgi:hypothetical protein